MFETDFCPVVVLRGLVLLYCDPSIPPEEFLGPLGPKLETELKMSFPGPSGPRAPKVKNKVKKSQKVEKELKFPLFDSLSTLFLTFWTAPGTHFQLRFQLWARRAQELLWGDGRVATPCMKFENPRPKEDKIIRPWVQRFYAILGLESAEKLLWHCQTPTQALHLKKVL